MHLQVLRLREGGILDKVAGQAEVSNVGMALSRLGQRFRAAGEACQLGGHRRVRRRL